MSEPAPFIPAHPEEQPLPPSRSVFRVPGFMRIWLAQVVSSLGDWIGLVAILALATKVSNSGTAVGLVMTARMLPGFLLAPLGGALVDRWNRKVVMVSCDIGRAGLLALLPFFDNLLGLVVLSFLIEVLTLLWGPAKDATVPNIVKDPEQLASANSLSLVAAYGTFPLGAVMFAALAGVAKWLGGFDALDGFGFDDKESLAIWFDSFTFLGSAMLISRLRLPEEKRRSVDRPDIMQTFRDVLDGLKFIRSDPLVRGVMIGLAFGLIGGGSIVPLGPVLTLTVLGGGSGAFGLLMTALGMGAAIGVVTLLVVQRKRKLPFENVFAVAIIATGVSIIATASVATLTPALFLTATIGATAGSAYVTGFTILQHHVSDELRGRTFATLYTIVRLCLLIALTVGPFVATAFGAVSDHWVDGDVEIGSLTISLPGVRLALWLGGVITVIAGLMARRRMRRAEPAQVAEA
ncbi:MAG: MFS transporter [Acidimicrobiia bacterium]